jgi:exopolysaccharide biosynthesis polyprenyl glycosylphosphotransferase
VLREAGILRSTPAPPRNFRARELAACRRYLTVFGISGVKVSRATRRPGRFRPGLAGFPEGPSAQTLLQRDARARRALAIMDGLAAAAAFAGAGAMGARNPVGPMALLGVPLLVLIAQPTGLYHRDEHVLRKTTLDEIPVLFQVASLFALLTWVLADLVTPDAVGAPQAVAVWLTLFVLMTFGRAAARCIVRGAVGPERCLVLGDAATAELLRRKFDVSFSIKATVVGHVDLTELGDLAETLVVQAVDRVIVVPDDSEHSVEAIRVVKALGVKISLLPRMLEVVGAAFEFDDVDGVTLLGIRRSQLNRSSHLLKRSLDIAAAALGLVVLAPALAIIAVIIRLDSPGPALYRQKRIGREGRQFEIVKFRSMVDGADAQKAGLAHLNETVGLFKMADDPRVTRVGRLLRRTSLDELPQLWNILRGEMSLVGPRPLVPDDDAKIHGWQRKRLNVTPGLTGVWQILGSTRVPLEEMVKLDYLYGATWSLWLDVKILLRTVAYVLGRRSA